MRSSEPADPSDAWFPEESLDWAMNEKSHSQRRACGLVGIEPKVYRYRSTRPDDASIRKRLRELAHERRRFGCRRLHILLKREGFMMNWSEAG